jgi:hypothetical protein
MGEGTQHLLKFLPLRDLPISACEKFYILFINHTLNAKTHICAKNTEAYFAGMCIGDIGGLLIFFSYFSPELITI